jgi:hypothetical protein
MEENGPDNTFIGIVCMLLLKGQCHEIFFFWFFHGSVSPKPLIIPIRRDICRFATGVVDTGGKWKKFSIRKIFMNSFGHLWVVELAYM